MKILALELSSTRGSIARLDDGQPAQNCDFPNDRKHSGLFFEYLQRFSNQFGRPNAIVVGLGPGSYAGTRIAIATAIGLREAYSARLLGIPSICALEVETREYCVIGDARRQSFFFARIDDALCVEAPTVHSASELETKIREVHGAIYASEQLPQFPQARLAFPSARRLAEIARAQSNELVDAPILEPLYLREPYITKPSRRVVRQ